MKTNRTALPPHLSTGAESKTGIGIRNLLLLIGLVFAATSRAHAGSPPVVTNATAIQVAGSTDVNIGYSVSDPDSASVNVWIVVSADGGSSWTVPAIHFAGAYGTNVAVTPVPSGRSVVWHVGSDWRGYYTTNCRVRVIACDNSMVLVPAGSYVRGNWLAISNNAGDPDIADAPAYWVFVDAFLMDNGHITGGQWNQVVGGYGQTHGYDVAAANQLAASGPSYKALNHPVTQVTWYEVVKWCNARSEMEGASPSYYTNASLAADAVYKAGEFDGVYVKPEATGYRLPTEAEWEKAARGGQFGFRFPYGNTIKDGPATSGGQANYYGQGYPYDLGPNGYNSAFFDGMCPCTSPAGSFQPNGYGLYDMVGNAHAWCWDWYSSTYYASGQSNPQGPSSGSSRVLRGGTWATYSAFGRCAYRVNDGTPVLADGRIGFRCVRGPASVAYTDSGSFTLDTISAGPFIASINLVAANVVLRGADGTPGAGYSVLASTGLSLPLASWTPLETNVFDANGGFAFTNGIAPASSQRFYRLQL